MKTSLYSVILIATLIVPPAYAQDPGYDEFLKEALESYDEFVSQINREYADFLAKPWDFANIQDAIPQPHVPPVPPIVNPDDDPTIPIEDEVIDIENIIDIKPAPSPEPKPIEPLPIPDPISAKPMKFSWMGTEFCVNMPVDFYISLPSVDPRAISAEWARISDRPDYMSMVSDLLAIKSKHNLADWPYVQLVGQWARTAVGNDSNKSAFLAGWAMVQSGFASRFGTNENGCLRHLIGTDYILYGKPYYASADLFFYNIEGHADNSINIVSQDFPKAKPVRMDLPKIPDLAWNSAGRRTVTVKHYPDIKIDIETNRNLLDFYSEYPVCTRKGAELGQWTNYADAQLTQNMKDAVYPILKNAIAGKSQRQAANILIDFCESFPYAYDDEVWGHDRAFFAEETLHYPGSDCEDHAILFTRLVRDLMGLQTGLLYYPGHLAAAVVFTEDIPGSYILHGGKKYTVCDPTIFYAEIGTTMRGMDNSKASLIVLN